MHLMEHNNECSLGDKTTALILNICRTVTWRECENKEKQRILVASLIAYTTLIKYVDCGAYEGINKLLGRQVLM
jgi:hypothetical protein